MIGLARFLGGGTIWGIGRVEGGDGRIIEEEKVLLTQADSVGCSGGGRGGGIKANQRDNTDGPAVNSGEA
jgi:hypothetical protein